MTVREQVAQKINNLNESELHQVAEYLSFLKFRSHYQSKFVIEDEKLSALYGEFTDEDRRLAEEGLEDYDQGLLSEDTQ